ncbi:hypothetical protein FNYG_06038 [Fusarium nygamai]|uniref:Sulfatase N-terminal domain-containing protein n=1 Tax=Gibberella nygamai TaxID=42673 RepID=A0A2K0WDT9_GIBNY|nr:hypothetical protein FNYG_06038 [Fusarium nygamai]
MVDRLFTKLEGKGLLDNTYVVFTSENRYHISLHRLSPGKTCGYEEDINVPLYILGPHIPVGQDSDLVTTYTDLLPTFFKMAGIL